jgi:hypothetical protein
VRAAGLSDPRLTDAVRELGPGAVLYTGGGIVRDNLLSLEGMRLLHAHPGLLPHVRGADGLLWSVLVRGRPAASCFYMDAGLDTGDVVVAEEHPPPRFPRAGADETTLYRALYLFYDPWLRAATLLSALALAEDPAALPAAPQDTGAGTTYHFMHARLRAVTFGRLFEPE